MAPLRVIPRFVAHVGQHPNYWTKLQVPPEVVVPEKIVDPTYDKIMDIMEGRYVETVDLSKQVDEEKIPELQEKEEE